MKLNRARRAAVIAACLSATVLSPAVAAPWWSAHLSDEGWLVVDIATIREVDGTTRAWSFSVIKDEAGAPAYASGLIDFDCKYEKTRFLAIHTHSRDATVIQRNDTPLDWEFAQPGSLKASMLDAVCDPSSLNPSRLTGKRGDGMSKFFEVGTALIDPAGYQAEKSGSK